MNKTAVVIPTYNVEPWVVQCIESVKAQDFDGLECIVVDDSSTDGTFDLAREAIAGDSRFRIVKQKHSGLSAARNLGLDLTDSELVMYVDSDDYILPGFVQSAVSFLEENGLQMAFFNGDAVNSGNDPHIFHGEQCYIHRCLEYGIGSGQDMFCRMMERSAYVFAVFLQIIRRDCIRHRFYDGILAQDKLYTTQNLLHLDRVGYLPDVLYIKRSRQGSAVSSKRGMHFLYSRTRFVLEMLKYIEEYGSRLSEETVYWLGMMLQKSWSGMVGIWQNMDCDEQNKICALPPESRTLLQAALGSLWRSKKCLQLYTQKEQ